LCIGNVGLKEQNRPFLVEAKNSVPYIWAPIRADGASGATGYRGSIDPGAGFVLGKGKSSRRKEVKR
jgi:hypothetical protein